MNDKTHCSRRMKILSSLVIQGNDLMQLLLCIACYACCCIPRIHAAIVDLNDTRLHELAYPGANLPDVHMLAVSFHPVRG